MDNLLRSAFPNRESREWWEMDWVQLQESKDPPLFLSGERQVQQKWVVVVRLPESIVCYGPFDTREVAKNWGEHNDDQFKGDWHIIPITPAF